MEIIDVDAEDLVQRAAKELREDSDDDSSDDHSEDAEEAGEEPIDTESHSEDAGHMPSVTEAASQLQWRSLKRKRAEPDEDDLCYEDRHSPKPPIDCSASSASNAAVGAPAACEPMAYDRQRARCRKKRKTQRDAAQEASGSKTKLFCGKRTAGAARKPVEIDLDSTPAREPVASSGFVCLSDPTLNGRREKAAKDASKRAPYTRPILLPTDGKYAKAELEAMGMTEDTWDGKSQVVYTDRGGREIVVLCGQPRDTPTSDWGREVAEAGFQLMNQLASKLSPLDSADHEGPGDAGAGDAEKKKRNLRRGDHRAETVGVGIGNGRKAPKNFHCDDDDAELLDTLLKSEPFIRIAGFANSIFLNFAPRLHEYYERTMDALFAWDPQLRRNFHHGTSVFPSCTFNFGPQTVTKPHLDLLNLAWGWCFITAFGQFDPNKGGHLILWDLKRFIRFPPGATIAILSALLRHSNVSIQQGETRYSFTQFAAGGLFRFVENGFQLNESVAKQVSRMSETERNAFIDARAARFSEGLKMYNVRSQ
ncbi:hypothetical protein HMN09_01050600 [Mycena chlorophos]|uniref:Uncharacterized protein n=1 Tax=Mycena chlorophos TaxID=658473 RepID=A0A8H6W3U2_MYCCL|nr:hypothetical protein HMN09_01050600 [Mycena chlorophos]